MKTKVLFLTALLTATLPLTSHAWGKKKETQKKLPENAWSILIETNNSPKRFNKLERTQDIDKSDVPQIEQPTNPTVKQHKTAPEQFAIAHTFLSDADKARAEKDPIIAMWIYDKAIKSYANIQNEYPDWQPAVIKFHRNHCEYHLKELLKEANKGETTDVEAPKKKINLSKQKNNKALTKAKILMMENKNKEARDILIKALMDDPDSTRTRLMIGIVQCRLKQYNDASYLLETLIEEHPGNANAHVILATAYCGINRNKAAITQLKQALKTNSFHKEANLNMAKLLFKTNPDDTEAIAKYYIKAVELGSPRDKKLDAAILKRQK